jgi:uncharacterized protein with FMN-binding domain
MRRITTWLLTTIATVVLLFSYHTSTTGPTSSAALSAAVPTGSSTSAAATSQVSTAAGSPPPIADSAPGAATSTQTVTGTSVSTRYGPVQVQLTVANGTIADASAIDYPTSNGRDRQINVKAVPVLEQETLDAQSADIDMVSGATYTSDGYLQSLQSAIDQANL